MVSLSAIPLLARSMKSLQLFGNRYLMCGVVRRIRVRGQWKVDLAPVVRNSIGCPLCGLPFLLLGRESALLERHGTDVTQRRVQSPMVVERQPVDHFGHGIAPGGKASSVQPTNLQPAPQARGGRVVPAITLAAYSGERDRRFRSIVTGCAA